MSLSVIPMPVSPVITANLILDKKAFTNAPKLKSNSLYQIRLGGVHECNHSKMILKGVHLCPQSQIVKGKKSLKKMQLGHLYISSI